MHNAFEARPPEIRAHPQACIGGFSQVSALMMQRFSLPRAQQGRQSRRLNTPASYRRRWVRRVLRRIKAHGPNGLAE